MLQMEQSKGMPDERARVVRVTTDDNDSLERMLSGATKDAYRRDFADERLGWIARAVARHIESCPAYARLAAAAKFRPEQLQSLRDLERVPLVPASLFKKQTVMANCVGDVLNCRSSGTKGVVSAIYRDEPTMERFVAGLLHSSAEFYERHEGRRGFVLGPTTEEAGTLWFSYVLGLLDLAYDTEFFVRNEEFQAEALAEALSTLPPDTQPLVVGPPLLIVNFCRWLLAEAKPIDLSGCDGFVVTAGGWKSHRAEAVDREELTQIVTEAFGIEPSAVRDVFNMVELNSLLFECEHRRKHVPPWLEIIVRNPSDMSRARPGEEGVLTYLDPTPLSYPGFIFSEDLGRLSDEPCACGRVGPTMTLSRRLSNVDERGCALKMDRYSRSQSR